MNRVKGFSFLSVCYLLLDRDGQGQGFFFPLCVLSASR